LEELGAFLILGAQFPYLVIGATKKWSQVTGFLMSDVLARDLSFLEGAQSNKVLFRFICAEASKGRAAHACLTHYRRDGSAFVNSVHAFPVFDGNHLIGNAMNPDEYSDVKMDENNSQASGYPSIIDAEKPVRLSNESHSTAVSGGVRLGRLRLDQIDINASESPSNYHNTADMTQSFITIENDRKTIFKADATRISNAYDGEVDAAKAGFIVLQFSVIVDSRS
jgi:hypothetical protein